ncbi:MAG: hypothetical protein VW906_09265 [Actinomycetota bacterium]
MGKRILSALAGIGLVAAGLVGVAAPASAFSNAPHYESGKNSAIVDCGDGNGPVLKHDITGGGGGVCNTAPQKVTLIADCGPSPSYCNEEGTSTGEVETADSVDVEDGDGETVEATRPTPPPPPPPCWDASINNCPVGGALKFSAPAYAMVGVPITMKAYASWRPDENSPAQPTNGTAVIRVDGEDYSGVEFKDGVAEWRFVPETEGTKDFTASGVLFSGYSGANAYIDTVPASVLVLPYDPAALMEALKKKLVEAGDKYTIVDKDQARAALAKRLEWNVSDDSEDVCAIYETKKGKVKAKFNSEGKCTVTWLDPTSGDEGKYTFIAKK